MCSWVLYLAWVIIQSALKIKLLYAKIAMISRISILHQKTI